VLKSQWKISCSFTELPSERHLDGQTSSLNSELQAEQHILQNQQKENKSTFKSITSGETQKDSTRKDLTSQK